jgi:hypothetical protein
MSKETPTYILIRMCSHAGHHLYPGNDADAALAIRYQTAVKPLAGTLTSQKISAKSARPWFGFCNQE